MRTVIGIALVGSLYIMIYYRLFIRHYHQKASGEKEPSFWSVFSIPSYRGLQQSEQKYIRRYWYAVSIMLICIALLVASSNIDRAV